MGPDHVLAGPPPHLRKGGLVFGSALETKFKASSAHEAGPRSDLYRFRSLDLEPTHAVLNKRASSAGYVLRGTDGTGDSPCTEAHVLQVAQG